MQFWNFQYANMNETWQTFSSEPKNLRKKYIHNYISWKKLLWKSQSILFHCLLNTTLWFVILKCHFRLKRDMKKRKCEKQEGQLTSKQNITFKMQFGLTQNNTLGFFSHFPQEKQVRGGGEGK